MMVGAATTKTCAVVAMVLFLPLVSAQIDYQNVLDENIATYVLIAIAVIYFSFTAVILIIAIWYCCGKGSLKKQKPFYHEPVHIPTISKAPLPTIQEEPSQLSNSVLHTPSSRHKKTTPHKPLTRLRSDEFELLDEETSQPSSPTEPLPPLMTPIRQTPDLRRKKQRETGSRASPNLPGTASPLEKTPETQRKQLPPIQPKTELPPIQTNSKSGTSPSPIHRMDNPRLESPRMKQRKHHAISPLSLTIPLTKTSSSCSTTSSSSKEHLEHFIISELGLPPEVTKTPGSRFKRKKNMQPLDTSYVMENKSFSEGVQSPVKALELHDQLMPLRRHWYQIGEQAKLPRATLQYIKEYCRNDDEKLMRLCAAWVEEEPELAWEEVVVVLRGRQLESYPATAAVVREIHTKFCRISPDSQNSVGTPDRSADSENSLTML